MSKVRSLGRRAVLIASALATVRRRYVEGLQARMPVIEVAEHASLIEHVVKTRPTVVFLDLALPGLRGIADIATIRHLHPPMKIVLLTDAPNERDAVFALVAGARGYCARALDAPLILKATEVVQQGEVWIGRYVIPHLLRKVASLSPADPGEPAAPDVSTALHFLAPKERKIALLVGAGWNNKAIALRLNISEATVKAHLTSVYRKVKVSDRLRLALFITAGTAPGSTHADAPGSSQPKVV